MSNQEIQSLLAKYRLKPSQALGQHYLIDKIILDRVIEAAQIKKAEPVLEIGGGPGILTRALAEAGAEVLTVEFDRRFCRLLQEEFNNWRNIKVLCSDALRLDLNQLGRQKIVANIPYQITNPLVRKILESGSPITLAILMIQAEVADRLTAPAGSTNRGILTIMAELYGSIEKIIDVPAAAFWPSPAVNSTVIRITRESVARHFTDPTQEKAFFWLVKQGFSGKRKFLINSLAGGLQLPKLTVAAIVEATSLTGQERAEDLAIEQWIGLFQNYQHYIGEAA